MFTTSLQPTLKSIIQNLKFFILGTTTTLLSVSYNGAFPVSIKTTDAGDKSSDCNSYRNWLTLLSSSHHWRNWHPCRPASNVSRPLCHC